MTSKEWSYLKEYVLKETGTISHDEYRYDKDEQETFEALIYSALKLYRSGKANKDKLDKAHEEFSKEPIFVETSAIITNGRFRIIIFLVLSFISPPFSLSCVCVSCSCFETALCLCLPAFPSLRSLWCSAFHSFSLSEKRTL